MTHLFILENRSQKFELFEFLRYPQTRGMARLVFLLCMSMGWAPLIVTVSWSFAHIGMARGGPEITEENGFLTGRVGRHFEAEGESRFAQTSLRSADLLSSDVLP